MSWWTGATISGSCRFGLDAGILPENYGVQYVFLGHLQDNFNRLLGKFGFEELKTSNRWAVVKPGFTPTPSLHSSEPTQCHSVHEVVTLVSILKSIGGRLVSPANLVHEVIIMHSCLEYVRATQRPISYSLVYLSCQSASVSCSTDSDSIKVANSISYGVTS